MPREKRYHVYIMASRSRILYVGVTGFLMARALQHKAGAVDGFTKKYEIHRRVYYETFQYVNSAIAREKQIKGWRRERKIARIAVTLPGKTWPQSGGNLCRLCKQQIPHCVRNDKW